MIFSSILNGEKKSPRDLNGEWFLNDDPKSSEKFVYSYRQVDEVMEEARKLHLTNRKVPVSERLIAIQALATKVLAAKSILKEVTQLELGRSDEDFALEWAQVERLFQSEFKPEVESYESRGVTAYVASYVWPLYYSLHFICMNLLSGNTLVIKPSERSTLVVARLMESLIEVPALKSWVHLLVGEKEMGRRLICHEHVSTVIFMGSFEVGMRVKQDTLSQSWKELLLYLGAKNPAIVCEDYPAETVEALLKDSFVTMGQHCRSTSILFVHQSRLEEFQQKFHDESKKVPMFRLIDPSMVERYLKFSGISEREGATVEMRGKPLQGSAVTPTLSVFRSITPDLIRKSVTIQTEILSPHLSIIGYANDEELLEITEKLQWGLCASVWTESNERFQKLAQALPFGQMKWNQSLLEWEPLASFQAYKKSGNHAYHGLKVIEQMSVLKSI